ncbi:MAG: hypothetical protein ACQERN_12635 [Thermodesulfobacteriota bacterium]
MKCFAPPPIVKYICIFSIAVLTVCLLAPHSAAQMEAMTDAELSEIYAEGFSDFTIENGTTKAWFNINTYSYITIDSLKLGYHDQYDYKDPNATMGWDENWEDVVFGESVDDPSGDFQTKGAFLEAEFENIGEADSRELKSITFGATEVIGDLSANFISFSGTIDDGIDNTPEYNGHRLNLGQKTITMKDADHKPESQPPEFSISLNLDGYDKGYWVNFNNAEVTDRQHDMPTP